MDGSPSGANIEYVPLPVSGPLYPPGLVTAGRN
jgi:hypothetical protein